MNSIILCTIIAITAAQIPYGSRRPYGSYGRPAYGSNSRPPYGSYGNSGFGGGAQIIFPDSPLYASRPIGVGLQPTGGAGFGSVQSPGNGLGFGSGQNGGFLQGGLQSGGGSGFGGLQSVGGQGFGGLQSGGGSGFGGLQSGGGQGFGGSQSGGGQGFGGLQSGGGQGFGGLQSVGGPGFGNVQPGGIHSTGLQPGGVQAGNTPGFGGVQSPIAGQGLGSIQTPGRCDPQQTVHANYQGSDYYFSWCIDGGKKYTWQEATQICTRLGPGWYGISIEDQSENSFVTQTIASHNLEYIWTGGQRGGAGWIWPSGRPFIPLDWSHTGGLNVAQPDNQEDQIENCLAVLNNVYDDGIKWHDVACYHPKPIICERSAAALG